MSIMKKIKIEKVTFNVGAGKDQAVLERGMLLLKLLTGVEPIKTITQKRIPVWGLRPGLPVGTKITIRDQAKIKDILTRCLKAKENRLKPTCFDERGNISFGIHEYIDIPGLNYDPKIGILGFQISITLSRPGFSLKNRPSSVAKKIGTKHLINADEAKEFMIENYKITIED
jgi:large subunit ribosomal protein L5